MHPHNPIGARERLDERREHPRIGNGRQHRRGQFLNREHRIGKADAQRCHSRLSDGQEGADSRIANRAIAVTKHGDQRRHSPRISKRAKHSGGLFANRPILVFERSNLFGYHVSHA